MTMRFSRRGVLSAGLGIAAGLATGPAWADEKTIRIGFQKYGTLILLKGQGVLEKALEPLGYSVSWTEFPAGPQLLEGLNVGAIDFGSTGEAPPIFAQAAGAPLVYVAHEPPAPRGEAILVPKDSAIQKVADLKGRKVALNKGYVPHGAMSFQTLHYPDSPNHPNFPSTELAPGQVFHEVTEYRFRLP